MANNELITKIRTSTGDHQIDYNALANLPDVYSKSEVDELMSSKVSSDQIAEVVGQSSYTKAQTLSDTTKTLFGLGSDAVPNDVFYALTNCFAQIFVTTNPNTKVTASLNGKTVSATADSSGNAILKIPGLGTWTISATINGTSISFDYEIKAIAQYEIAFSTDLENSSWNVIDAISKSGNAASIWSVGDKKTVNIDRTSYQFQIIGFNHDTKTEGGKAGITFQMVDCFNEKYSMNGSSLSNSTNVGGWKSSAMRSRMNTFLVNLDEDLQSVIKPVNKMTSAGNKSSTIETVSDKLFLLSEVEISGSAGNSYSGEGTQYDWYKAGNTKVKKVNGAANDWWGRSPCTAHAQGFFYVKSNGNIVANMNYYSSDAALGVSFAFCV